MFRFHPACVLVFTSIFGYTVAQTRTCEDYTPTVDGGRCTEKDESCEFKIVVGYKLTLTKPNGTALFVDNYKVYSREGGPAWPEAELKDVILGDGASPSRYPLIVANGTMPGPCLTIYKDQKIAVTVVNKLYSESLTVHWHGLDMERNSYMDGVAFVTQCPIQPGESFRHTFSSSVPGSYWYHSHIGAQRTMGVLGPLIVRDRENGSLPRNERVLVLQDWNHDYTPDHIYLGVYEKKDGQLLSMAPTKSLDGAEVGTFPFHSGLINGRGRFFNKTDPSGIQVEYKTPLEVIEVERDQQYRFRVVNAGAIYAFRVSVQGHRIGIMATDAYDIEEIAAESFVVYPGERYDFMLTTNQTVNEYMILAETLQVDTKVRHVAEAILRYKGASVGETPPVYLPTAASDRGCSSADPCVVVNCPFSYFPTDDFTRCVHLNELKALGNRPAPDAPPDEIKEIFLNFAFPGKNSTPPSINGIAYQNPPVAAILQPKTMPTRCDMDKCGKAETQCTCTHTVTLTRNIVHQIVLLDLGNGQGFSHPVHIHGYTFYVVKMGYPQYNNATGQFLRVNEDITCEDEFCNVAKWNKSSWSAANGGQVPGLNLENPPRKDTIIIPTGGYAVIRIRAHNPGMWFVHCHVEFHQLGGMALIFEDSAEELGKPPQGFPSCGNFPKSHTEMTAASTRQTTALSFRSLAMLALLFHFIHHLFLA